MKLKDAGIYDMINIFKGVGTKAHNASRGELIHHKVPETLRNQTTN